MSHCHIIVKNLGVKLYSRTIVKDISFTIQEGQHLAITGPSGTGKTTVAKAFAGQVFHSGSVEIASALQPEPLIHFTTEKGSFKNLSNLSAFYYQQRFNSTEAEDALTVMEELTLSCSDISNNLSEVTAAIQSWLHSFGLTHRMHTPLIQLSNGEAKKLHLVKALLKQPDILILDEPFTGLDVQTREELQSIIDRLSAQLTIILISAHHELPSCITHIAHLEGGTLHSFGDKQAFLTAEVYTNTYKPLPAISALASFTNAVSMRHVNVRYGNKKILSNLNWTVAKGERWLLKGPNGAGKSTLLSLITGDNPQAYANEIFLFDRRRGTGESIWDIKKNIGFISPELHLYFDKGLTVYETIASGLFDTMGLYRSLDELQKEIVASWIDYFNLAYCQSTRLQNLSSGVQRSVLLARALVKAPPLLILDEPCQGLDAAQTRGFISLINQICEATDTTLIYVSHYDAEIPACITKKMELANGLARTTTYRGAAETTT
jgi:molybdate transport system ATP-binding protein